MWGAFSKTEYSLMSVLPSKVSSMSKKTQVACFEIVLLPFRKDATDLGWNISMHLKPTSVSSDTWPKLSQEQYLTLTLYHQDVHVVGQRLCTERVRFGHSVWEGLGYFILEFLAGSSSHRHACHHCLYVKKKVIFPFLNFSLFLSLSFPDHLMLDG